jgi:hypothetical protein
MKIFTTLRHAAGALLLAFAFSAPVRATLILDVTSAVDLTDPTQSGRLSRNGIPQDWANTEAFSGVINPTITYHYRTFEIDPFTSALGPYMQVSFDSLSPNTFVAGYFAAYEPNPAAGGNLGLDTHWLGDAGTSRNYFGVDPVSFQVVVPFGESFVVVVNTTSANPAAGIGDPFELVVESFSDTNYNDAAAVPPVPEPSTYGLFGAAVLSGLIFWRRRNAHRDRAVKARGRENPPAESAAVAPVPRGGLALLV